MDPSSLYTHQLKILTSTEKCWDVLLENLQHIDGVQKISMNFENAIITICCNIPIDMLINAIRQEGLIAEEIRKYSPNLGIYYY